MEHRIPLDKKMELAQYIRAENMGNRMKVRQREKILYGTNPQPLFPEKGLLSGQNLQQPYGMDMAAQESGPALSMGSFKYRMILAVLLFVGFLVCDTSGAKLGKYSMSDVQEMIVADTFHLYEGDGGDTMDALASLLDFGG